MDSPYSYTRIRETWLSQKPWSRAGILTAWLVFFLLVSSVFYWKDVWHLNTLMPASGKAVFENKEYWRLWSTLFAHADIGHLLSNSLTFFVVGYFLIGYFSFWFFPVAALLFGGVINAFALLTYPPEVKLIGISGVVYWMAGAWLVLYFLLDQRKTRTQRALRSIGVALAVFMPATAFDPNISYITHLFGFIGGVFAGTFYYYLNRQKFLAAEVRELVIESETVPEEEARIAEENNSILH